MYKCIYKKYRGVCTLWKWTEKWGWWLSGEKGNY